jgi:hypothetical protein
VNLTLALERTESRPTDANSQGRLLLLLSVSSQSCSQQAPFAGGQADLGTTRLMEGS